MVDVSTAKRALTALAHGITAKSPSDGPGAVRTDGPSASAVIDRASEVVEDLDRAAAFVDAGGLERLRTAVDRSPDRETRRRGERALAAFERYRRAAAGGRHPDRDAKGTDADCHPTAPRDQFRSGRGTDIRRGSKRGDT